MFSHFQNVVALSATILLATSTFADRLFFDNNSHLDRVITFFPETRHGSNLTFKNPGPIFFGAGANRTVDLTNFGPEGYPEIGWSGTVKVLYPHQNSASPVPLGDFTFLHQHLKDNFTYFDLSLINDGNNNDGIHWIYPINDHDPLLISGCDHFPCNGSYSKPHGFQMKHTWDTDFKIIIQE